MRTKASERGRRFRGLLAAGAVGSLVGVAAAVPASAVTPAAAAPNQWAYIFADQPTTASYAANSAFSRSSSGGAITISRQATGTYLVDFAGLTGTGGTVDVTAAAYQGEAICQNAGFEGSTTSVRMSVRCFDSTGAPADSQFYAAFEHVHAASGRFAYGAFAPGAPIKPYRFSTGGKIAIKHLSTGLYQVDLAGLASPGGTVMTTPIGTNPQICSPASWHAVGKAERIYVVCTAPDGTVADSAFAFTFADHQGLFGNKSYGVGYTWGSKPTTSTYAGPKAYSFMYGGSGQIRIAHSGVGTYVVTFPKLIGPENVQVRPTGGPGRSCQVFSLSVTTQTQVVVACYGTAGAPADSAFVVQVVGGPLP